MVFFLFVFLDSKTLNKYLYHSRGIVNNKKRMHNLRGVQGIKMEDNKNINVNENKDNDNKDNDTITISPEELERRIQQAVYTNSQNEKKKYQKELEKQKSLIGLDEQERLKAENADLENQLKELRLSNIKLDTVKVLEKRGLSADLVDFVVMSDDVDEVKFNIDKLDKLFKKAVADEIAKKVNSTATKNSNNSADGSITKEQFRKMSIAEQTKLFNSNPDLFTQLTK